MADFAEVERMALELSQEERARLAARLIESLTETTPGNKEKETSGFKRVSSSMLRRVRYDAKNRFLDIVFRTGEIYRYKGVPPHEYEGLMKADSHGKYMQRYIIDQYETVKIESRE